VSRRGEPQKRNENEIEFARIVAFSDGVFAIAITLLVLNLGVPEHIRGHDLTTALWEQREDLLAYALSFAVIGRFWIIHHRFFSDVTGFDGKLLGLNLFYLAWIVLIPFSTQVLGEHGSDTAALVLYALNLAGVVLVGMWMFSDARRAGLLTVSERDAREFRNRSMLIAAVFICSIPLALFDSRAVQITWLALFLAPRIAHFGSPPEPPDSTESA
jgi:uncharacterized membrane protein